MKHSPGPWSLLPKHKVPLRGACFHYRHDIIGSEFGEPIASLYGNEQQEVNARLIATAPELLHAIKTLAFHADNSNDSELKVKALRAALRAIDKAEGRDDESTASALMNRDEP